MRTLKTLVDEACLLCGGGAAVGRAIGAERSEISDWKTGRRTMSPVTVGLLCDLLQLSGEEARRLCAEAVIDATKDEKKAGVLRRAFFGPLVLGVVLGLGQGATSAKQETNSPHVSMYVLDCLYIVLRFLRSLLGLGQEPVLRRSVKGTSFGGKNS